MTKWFCIFAFALSSFSLTGCGGTTETTVIQPTEEGGLSADDQATYEQSMMEASKKAKPGN